MQRLTIPDADINNTDPETLIRCFTPWVKKIASLYNAMLKQTGAVDYEDLCQVGKLALLTAQEKYDPSKGASFLKHSSFYIRNAMRKELGIINGKTPPLMMYLDMPLHDDTEETLLYMLVDDSIEPFDERMVRLEQYDELHRAIDRLNSCELREIIRRVYFYDEDRKSAAAAMGMTINEFYRANIKALHKLRKDYRLRMIYKPSFDSSLRRYRITHTSAIEAEVLWKERVIEKLLGTDAYTQLLLQHCYPQPSPLHRN